MLVVVTGEHVLFDKTSAVNIIYTLLSLFSFIMIILVLAFLFPSNLVFQKINEKKKLFSFVEYEQGVSRA